MELIFSILIYLMLRFIIFNLEALTIPKFYMKKFFVFFVFKNRKWQRLCKTLFHVYLLLISHEIVLIINEQSLEQLSDGFIVSVSSLIGFKLILWVYSINLSDKQSL